MHGCYQYMRGSFVSDTGRGSTAFGMADVFESLTGGTAERVCLEPGESESRIFAKLLELTSNGWLAALGTRDDCDRGGSGLVPAHAYSVVRACRPKSAPVALVQVRNTWGGTEWQG